MMSSADTNCFLLAALGVDVVLFFDGGISDSSQAKQAAFEEFQEDLRKRRGEPSPPPSVTQHDAAVAKVGEVAAAVAVAEATGEANLDGQRRLEMLEIRMKRELAEQRWHADEQVRELERLQRAQLEAQQNQHAQLLATIQQQQQQA
ncbi:ARS-binding protein 1 [Phytophthora cinnamomi]|uniref:ARS-binding protein 1 n=1 Tax=Phytophthora cinnamomi TaxID=4785 RepID=UPI00355A84C0|nr:ARS-binding protein 1 [Phytophthora cinnamomi]